MPGRRSTGELVVFDLDDTLVDRAKAYERWAESFCRAIDGGPTDLAWLIEVDQVGLQDRDRWAALIAERYELGEDPRALRARWHEEYLTHYTVDDETFAALIQLRDAGHRIGIVTNGPPSQADKITRNCLHDYVDGFVVSDLVGARKPERAIFEAVATACGCGLSTGWMIGDSAPADMAGGRAAGLRTIWMHLGRAWDEVGHLPDPWAAGQRLAMEPLPAGWRPEHEADDIPSAVEIVLSSTT